MKQGKTTYPDYYAGAANYNPIFFHGKSRIITRIPDFSQAKFLVEPYLPPEIQSRNKSRTGSIGITTE